MGDGNTTNKEEKNVQEKTIFIDKVNFLSQESIPGKFKIKNEKVWIPDVAKKNYHDQRLSQSKWAFRLSLWGSVVGIVVIVFGIWKSVSLGKMELVPIISGSVLETISGLFYYISNMANEKITEFFQELTKDSNVKEAIGLSEKVTDDNIRDELLVKLSLHLSGIDDEKICKNTKEVCEKENK